MKISLHVAGGALPGPAGANLCNPRAGAACMDRRTKPRAWAALAAA